MKKNTLVKFVADKYTPKKCIFKNNEVVLFLDEISNMPGHCAVVKKNGKLVWGCHTDDFIKAKESEI